MQLEDRLIEERIRQEGGEIWDSYQHALRHGDHVRVFPDHFGAGIKTGSATTAPRLTEAFLDRVISRAGGARYNPPGSESSRPLNADYLIDDLILELKDIEENALTKPTRQKRLAALMRGAGCHAPAVPLDPTLLAAYKDRREFLNIIGEPIDNALSNAARQISVTRETLGKRARRGGVILINSGTHFYSHDLFIELAGKFAGKPSRRIDELFCFTSAMHTNGFDHRIDFATFPSEPTNQLQERILNAFWTEEESLMINWARDGMQHKEQPLPPHQAFGFDDGGQTFYWLPETLPSSFGFRSVRSEPPTY